MRYVLDTNILIHLVRNDALGKDVMKKYDLLNPQNQVFISIATRGEIISIAGQKNWETNNNMSDIASKINSYQILFCLNAIFSIR